MSLHASSCSIRKRSISAAPRPTGRACATVGAARGDRKTMGLERVGGVPEVGAEGMGLHRAVA